MAIRKRKPTSAGRRFQTVSDFSDISKSTPEKTLLAKKSSTGGRNSYGRKTARHKGGGNKNQYRIIDFKRTKDGVTAKVVAIDRAARKLSLTIKGKEMEEEKQAMAEYGSSDSGASLGDILGAAIRRRNQMSQDNS